MIVRRDPRIAFRVVENQMNYAYLGKRLMSSAAENFPIFLADLCARADQAYPRPPPRGPCWSAATRPSTSFPRPRRSWNTPPIVCSGAGIAGTAGLRPIRFPKSPMMTTPRIRRKHLIA